MPAKKTAALAFIETPESMARTNLLMALDDLRGRTIDRSIEVYADNVLDTANELWPDDMNQRSAAIGAYVDLVAEYRRIGRI
jgi:hypothetical protein